MIHELKSWPNNFRLLAARSRNFDIRSNKDRTFAAGDYLLLREWEPEHAACSEHGQPRCRQGCSRYTVVEGHHTGSLLLAQVVSVLTGNGALDTLLPTGTAALSLQVLDETID